MKKLIWIVLFSALSASVFAKIRTVSNVDSAAQYSTIQGACDGAISGDSIYVSESPVAYQAFTIQDKKLAIFGPGWSPFVGGIATVSTCTLVGVAASGSELHGLTFTSSVIIQTQGINYVNFFRNKLYAIQFYGVDTGYLFEGNWFNATLSYLSTLSRNFLFRNNIFYTTINSSPSLSGLKGVNIAFDHNVWYGGGSCFSNCQNLSLSNNLFVGTYITGISLSVFNNNVTFNCSNNAPWNISNNIDGGGNLPAQDPQMVAQQSVNDNVNDPLLDFTIPTGPANNAGSDKKDIGLLYEAGRANWSRSRAAHIPYISKLTITDLFISKTGKLYFNAQSKSN